MNVTALVLVGLFVGVVGGLFGVGGGIILIPALNEVVGANQHLYQATAMVVNFFVAVPAVYQHHAARAIEFRTVGRVVPLSIVAVLLGVAASELRVFSGSGEAYLRAIFGFFLLGCAAYDVSRAVRRHRPGFDSAQPASTRVMTWRQLASVALPTGFASGLLGVGGGIVAVPLQRRFLGVPVRTAIANSAAIIAGTSLVGALFKNLAYLSDRPPGPMPFALAGVLIPTAVAGSLLGSRLTHRLPTAMVKGGFVILLVAAGLRLLQSAAATLW